MLLTNAEIKEHLYGYVKLVEDDEGIHPFKSTDKQLAAWNEHSEILGERANDTTGVVLDFHTDSDFVNFTVKGGKFGVNVNGLSVFSKRYDEYCTINIKLSKESRVTLIFPSHDPGILKSVEISDGAALKKHKYNKKIFFIGDSITQGWKSGIDTYGYPFRVANFLNAEMMIWGIGGTYFSIDTYDNIDFEPDLVTVAFGTNDFRIYKTLAQLETEADGFISRLANRYDTSKILGILPIWRSDEDTPKKMGTFAECRAAIKKLYDKYGIKTVDGYDLVPHVESCYFDAIHPNALGFSFYAQNLTRFLQNEMGM